MNPKSSNVHAKVRVPQLMFGIILYNLPSVSLSFMIATNNHQTSTILCQEVRPFWPCMVYSAHEIRSGSEATDKVKLKSYLLYLQVTYHQYELLRQLQARFRSMSALTSAASPEKMDGNTKLRF